MRRFPVAAVRSHGTIDEFKEVEAKKKKKKKGNLTQKRLLHACIRLYFLSG